MPPTIDELVADLTPVRRLAPGHAWALTLALTVLAVLAVYALYGLRSDIMAGQPAGIAGMARLVSALGASQAISSSAAR